MTGFFFIEFLAILWYFDAMDIIIILLVVAIVLGFWVIALFNRLVRLRNRVKEAWSDIEVQLKRRYDLIPNLVESVKGYMGHEAQVFENVTRARAAAMNSTGSQKAAAENELSGTLKTLFAVSENYPQLRANENFLHLQQELTDTENKLQAARRFYNGNVRDFNTTIETFPGNMIASAFSFSISEFFDAEPEAEKPVQVKF